MITIPAKTNGLKVLILSTRGVESAYVNPIDDIRNLLIKDYYKTRNMLEIVIRNGLKLIDQPQILMILKIY